MDVPFGAFFTQIDRSEHVKDKLPTDLIHLINNYENFRLKSSRRHN
ncbi:hypothetical protein SRABI96_04829 [Peribacillus sp. Bi96]|nr:hypothetical protein SRABI96_04829 [Peribacillus sp. Bi96]